ncbi:MAG: hypothetical protein H7841_04685 [Magnetospirillum sp. WYHS-4]
MRIQQKHLALAALLLVASPVLAQMASFGSAEGGPIEVQADNGIEWQQERKVFLARGNAVATRGATKVNADTLRAHYREKGAQGGGADIWRLEAEGNVVISTPGEKAYGDRAEYDVDQAVVILTGRQGAKLVAPNDTVTADRQIEYWQGKRLAVARGNAQVVHKDQGQNKKLRAEIVTAHFREDKSGKTQVFRVEAFERVQIDTETETVTADKAVYNVESGIATLTGSVKIRRGPNELNGCAAEVNLNSGVSRLHGCGQASDGGHGRVKGTLMPTKRRESP